MDKILYRIIMILAGISSCILVTSCCDDITIDEINVSNNYANDGVPMRLNVNIKSDESTSRSISYEWPEGATLLIYETGYDGTDLYDPKGGYYLYAEYHEDTGWIAYNLNGKESVERTCIVYYSESWTYEQIKFDEDSRYLNNGKYSSSSSGGAYASIWFDSESDTYGMTNTTCSFKDGFFYLNAELVPLFGRVRFVCENPVSVEYNHAKNDCYHPDEQYSCINAAATDFLEFHLEEDGKYYSNYIYSRAIPEIKIGDYVYKYKGNPVLKEGDSGCISLPTEPKNSNTWICEKYFEILYTDEQILNINGDVNRYFQLYTQEFSNNTGEYGSDNKSMTGPNIVHSSIGLNVEIDFTVNSFESRFDIVSHVTSEHDGYTSAYYKGRSYHSLASNIGVRQKYKQHECYTSKSDCFNLYLSIGTSIGHEKPCIANMTLHSTKISNF